MSKREKKFCPHCGASMNEHKHNLSKALVIGLDRLDRHGGEVNIKHLNLTRNQWDNFQKLRYWGLAEQVRMPDGRRQNGIWRITEKGKLFLKNEISLQKNVWTYRGEAVRFEGNVITVFGVYADYKQREDYREDMGGSTWDWNEPDDDDDGPRPSA